MGTFLPGNTSGVDPRLVSIIKVAAESSPYTVQITSGKRPFNPARPTPNHPGGWATDINLSTDGGKTWLSQKLHSKDTPTFQDFATKYVRPTQMQMYPELNGYLRWGGWFNGKYAGDVEHFDITPQFHGAMGAGKWANGSGGPIPPMNVGETAQGRQMPLGMGRGQIKTGPQVRQLQQQLADAGFNPGQVDGVFGPKTAAAVRAAETKYGLTPDRGVAGPQVLGALETASHPAYAPGGGVMPPPAYAPGGAVMPPQTTPNPAAFQQPQRPITPTPGGVPSPFNVGAGAMPGAGSIPSPGYDPSGVGVPEQPLVARQDVNRFDTEQMAGGRTPFPNIITDFPGYVKRSMEVAMPDVQSIPRMLRGGVPGGPAVPPPPVSPDPNQFGPDMAFLNRLAQPLDESLPASVPGGPAEQPSPYQNRSFWALAGGLGQRPSSQAFDTSRFASEPYAGGMSPINPPQFDASRFASEPNAGGMAPINPPAGGTSINDVIAGVKGIPAALGLGDWFGSSPVTAAPLPPPAVSPGASYVDDHYGAGLSARPYPSGVPYSPPRQTLGYSGSGGDNYLVGSGGPFTGTPYRVPSSSYAGNPYDFTGGGAAAAGAAEPPGAVPAGGEPFRPSMYPAPLMNRGTAPDLGPAMSMDYATPQSVYTPPDLRVSLAGSPTDQANALVQQITASGVTGASPFGPPSSGTHSGGGGGNSGGAYFGQSPGGYSYAGVTPWGSPSYTTPSGGYSNSPYTPSGQGWQAPNFTPGSGGSTYATLPNGYGGGTYLDSHGNPHQF